MSFKIWVKTIPIMWEFLQSIRHQNFRKRIDRFSKFGTDIIFAENMSQVESLVIGGIKRENIVIVGSPVFDNAFTKRKQLSKKINNKLNILFTKKQILDYHFLHPNQIRPHPLID